MKNYFQKIITLFTGNDYPESTQQDFYKWLVDEEHTSEKDEALQKLWDEAHKQRTATDMQEAYELLKKNAGIPPIQRKRTIRPIHIWQAAAAVFFLVAAYRHGLCPEDGTRHAHDRPAFYVPDYWFSAYGAYLVQDLR